MPGTVICDTYTSAFFMLETIKTRNVKKFNLSIIRTDDRELGHGNNITLPCLFTSPLCTRSGFSCGIFLMGMGHKRDGWDISQPGRPGVAIHLSIHPNLS